MAERRMFSKKVVNSGRFLRLPVTARLLYFDLGMSADDDGIVEAYTVMQADKMTEDDLRTLAGKGFVRILNDDLVTLICDWKVNNLIRKDRYHQGIYAHLLDDSALTTKCQPSDNQMEPEVRKGEERKGKDRLGEERKGEPEPEVGSPFVSFSIEERFRDSFGRSPDKSFLSSVRSMMQAGKPVEEIKAVMDEASARRPQNPEAYILAMLKQYQPPVEEARKPWRPSPAPTGELTEWERDWLANIERRRKARETEGGKTDETM